MTPMRRSVRDAMAALDPLVVAQLSTPQQPTPASRAKYRGSVRRQVLGCTRCGLRKTQPDGRQPVAFSCHVPTPAFVVVGEAPGPQESIRGEPFVGPAGKLLRALMTDADIDPDDLLWANTVSCFPNEDGRVGKPTDAQKNLCRENMFAQIEASYCHFVLLVGAHAMSAFRNDLQVTNHHGRLFVWMDTYAVMGIIHPAAVLRGQKQFKKLIREDLATWRDVVYGEDNALAWLGDSCVKCGGDAAMWDRDGVPYCAAHWEKWGDQWRKQRERWDGTVYEQLSM